MYTGSNVSEETAVSEIVGPNYNTPCVTTHKSVIFMLSSCNITLTSTKILLQKPYNFPEVQPQH